MADDLEFYYFMRYGKIPKTISNPGLAEFLKKDKQACHSMNLLKASVAFFGLFFFAVIFVILGEEHFASDKNIFNYRLFCSSNDWI